MGIGTMKKMAMQCLILATICAYAPLAHGIPAFARKYGLPCSACHEAWPMLNNFGQTFKDNGYQLGNERDAPIYQQPAYWPIMFRTTPLWHRESNNRQAIDVVPGNAASGQFESVVTTSGFDLDGVDVITAGTLYKNISFFVQPFIGNNSTSHSPRLGRVWIILPDLIG